ncbi:MAG: hypothetical protein KF768_08780 [Phycisphaeraceae bacterium]|nr:hypothetical protein [Phycisphaeraceae bacterium]
MTAPPPPPSGASGNHGQGNNAHAAERLNDLLTRIRKRHGEAVAVLAANGASVHHAAKPGATTAEGQVTPDAHESAAPTHAGSRPSTAFLEADQPVLAELVRSFLVWEAGTAKAASAIRRIEQAVVDFNDLRVCMHDEFLRLLGKSTPKTEDRAMRMRAALNDVYLREHGMTLEHLPALPKREAREYLESVEGVPRFVAARTILLALSGHAAPVDSRILRVLTEARAVPPTATTDDAAALLEKRIRAGELLEAYLLLQAQADEPARGETEQSPPAAQRAKANGSARSSEGKKPGKSSGKHRTEGR